MSDYTKGIVFLVGAGPGDPGLITLRALECLQKADVVVYDRLANHHLLGYAPNAEWIDAGKMPEHHKLPQERINQLLIDLANQGKVVVRLKGGDPFVFGRGGEEASTLTASGIPFEIVPGITSAIAAPAYAGIPVTYRDLACSVAVITGHRANRQADCSADWRRLAESADTLVFLMGMHNLPLIVEQLIAGGRPSNTPIAIIAQGTRPTQQTTTGTLADIVEKSNGVQPPAVIVVGDVVRLRDNLQWFDNQQQRPLLGMKVLNPRSLTGRGPDPFSLQLLAAGAEPIEVTTSRLIAAEESAELIRTLHRLGNKPDHPDWIIFTSANAVHFTMEQFCSLGYDVRALAGINLAVIGKATCIALQNWHINPDFIANSSTTTDLTHELGETTNLVNQHMILPRSSAASMDLPLMLSQAGARVETITTYTVQPLEPDPAALETLLNKQINAAAFLSPTTIQSLADCLINHGTTLAKILTGLPVVCIGPATAKAALSSGIKVTRVVSNPSINAIITALQDILREQTAIKDV